MIHCVTDDELRVLKADMRASRRAAYACGTRKNLKTQWKAFYLFCLYFDYTPVPASLECVCVFAQFLSRSFVSVQSIRSYLSGVSLLHKFLGVDYPHTGCFALRLTLRGLERLVSHAPSRAAPITPEILLGIHRFLDLSSPEHSTIWCLFLFAFFLMARSSNLVCKSVATFDPCKQLLRRDIFKSPSCLLVLLKWSKTNQSRRRRVQIPLLPLEGNVLCPVKAFTNMCSLVPAPKRAPAFCLPYKNGVRPITYDQFQTYLRDLLSQSSLEPRRYSTHSFRRGGASWAFKAQVPSDLIQVHGDWASDAYKVYLDCDVQQRALVNSRMGAQILEMF